MTTEEKKDYINALYLDAMRAGMCNNVREFAELVGINYTTVSSAMNGNARYLTNSLFTRIQRWATYAGLREGDVPRVEQHQPEKKKEEDKGVYIPHETMEMYTSMAKAIENMSEIIRNTGAPAPTLPTQKNFQTDK